MEQTKNNKSSSFVAFYFSALILGLLAAVLLLPKETVMANYSEEIDAIYVWLGESELSYSDTLYETLVREASEGMVNWFGIGTETYTNEFVINLTNWVATRLKIIQLLLNIWAIRVGIVAHWSIAFMPLLLGCLLLGHLQREYNKSRYSFTSPFWLSFSIRACKFLFFACLTFLLTPWYVHPWLIPMSILLFSLSSGVAVTRLQKNL